MNQTLFQVLVASAHKLKERKVLLCIVVVTVLSFCFYSLQISENSKIDWTYVDIVLYFHTSLKPFLSLLQIWQILP